ncbi:MAG TPA: serine/threonine-protein kinase [Actinomycetota bacterium]|jgi:streptogramin lyase/predicted Ser/Thr protein kinase
MAEDTRVGTELAGYRIEGVIGRGGMSVVYLAEHARLERKVALKVLAPELAGSERFHDRFLRESKLAASIDHPNIVPIYDADEAEGVLYIAMRYVEGSDLKQVIRDNGPLEPLRVSRIVDQVASALDAAHERGLVHRDVKPANVLLTPQDHAYVSDFGLTKRAVSVSGLTETGQLIGTIDYVAPEQIKGDPVDHRADVYSLGCLLFECLSGHAPYPRDIEVGVLWAHVETPPPSVTEERADLPSEVDDVVAGAMAKDPAERSAAAGDVAAGFRSALGLEAPTGGQVVVRRRSPKSRRRRAFVAAIVAGIVLLAGAGVFVLTQGGGAGAVVPSADSVARIDASTNGFVEAIRVGEDPTGIAVGEDGDLWVINQEDSTVNRIDPETGEVTTTESTLGIPTGVAAGEGAVWITNGFGSQSGTQVVKVEPSDESVEPAFPTGNAKAIVVAFGSIWLADADRDRVLRYDPEDLPAEPTVIPVDGDEIADESPRSLAVGSGAAEGVWVVNELGETIVRINPETNEVASTFQVDAPTAVAADDSGIWATSETLDRVYHLDPVDGRALRTYQAVDGVPDGPTAIAIAPSGVWVGSDLDTAVARIDPGSDTIDRLRLGGITGWMAVDGRGDVWVTVRAQPS